MEGDDRRGRGSAWSCQEGWNACKEEIGMVKKIKTVFLWQDNR